MIEIKLSGSAAEILDDIRQILAADVSRDRALGEPMTDAEIGAIAGFEPGVPVMRTEPIAPAAAAKAEEIAPVPLSQTAPAAEPPAEPPAEPAPKRGRGRPPKARDLPALPANAPEPADGVGVQPAASAEPVAETVEVATESAAEPTPAEDPVAVKARMNEVLRKLCGARGLATGVAMFEREFGVRSAKDLPPERYLDVIAAAERILAEPAQQEITA